MNDKEKIEQIKNRIRMFHIIVILLLAVDAVAWFSTLIVHYENNTVLLAVGLSCVGFMVLVIVGGIFIERRIKRHLKSFVESFAGAVSAIDIDTAKTLLKKWKKHYIASIKWVLAELREEKYPFGQQLIEDLGTVKKGIKVERRSFYALLTSESWGETGNRLLSEIALLLDRNTYTLH